MTTFTTHQSHAHIGGNIIIPLLLIIATMSVTITTNMNNIGLENKVLQNQLLAYQTQDQARHELLQQFLLLQKNSTIIQALSTINNQKALSIITNSTNVRLSSEVSLNNISNGNQQYRLSTQAFSTTNLSNILTNNPLLSYHIDFYIPNHTNPIHVTHFKWSQQ